MSTDVESGQQTLEFEGGDSFEEFGGPEAVSVSYTHLTLPTILLV